MLLVTGATGFIGRALATRLLGSGRKIRIISRNPDAGKILPGAEVFRADLSDPKQVEGAARGVDTVVHLAGLVSYSKTREEIFAANAETTRNLLEECGNVRRFVFSSSVSVYGEILGSADESYPTGPRNPYGESKLECERLITGSGIPHVILRIAPVYGAGSPSWRKNLSLLEKGFPIPKTGNLTHVVHVSDAVQALEKSLKKGRGIYNIAGREPVPFADFAGTLVRLLGKPPRRLPMFLVRGLARPAGLSAYLDVLTMNRNYSIGKAMKELGYAPDARFMEAVKDMVDWYRGLE